MISYLRIFSLFLALTVAMPAFAQTPAEPASKEVTVNPDELKKLITTLESETGRTEFLQNLKTLAETQADPEGNAQNAEEAIEPLTKTLGVEGFTEKLVSRYEVFLNRTDLKGSTVGKIGVTVLVVLAFLVFNLVFRRVATKGLYYADRAITWLDLPARRLRFYSRVIRSVVTAAIGILMLYTLFIIWHPFDYNPFEAGWFKTSARTFVNIGFVLFLGALIWEGINAILHVTVKRLDAMGSLRAKTILPIVRNVVFIVFGILFALVLLSEIGINILPLLAGAGIVGVAIGFGAQTMVKDFLSGFTLILEDVIRVGDIVNVGGYGGLVEKITLRKVQLRDYNGSVYTVPFSEIKTVTNMTKDFSMYELNIGVAYKDDPDKVFDVMRKVAEEMRAEDAYKNDMLEPIEIAGVDKFADSAVIIKARLKTAPIKQWNIGREYNRRIRKAFADNNIEIPFPQQVTWNANPQVTVFKKEKGAEIPSALAPDAEQD